MDGATFVILALTMISASLTIIFYISWRSFGRRLHALAWSVTFGVATVQWAGNILNRVPDFFPNFTTYWMIVSGLSYTAALMGLTGYLLRAGRHVPLRWMAIAVVVADVITYLSIPPGGHFGITVALSPMVTSFTTGMAAWVLYSAKKRKNAAEWGAIGANTLFCLTQVTMAAIALSNGYERDPEIQRMFGTVMFLTLPTAFTACGLFMVTVLASDLAEKVQAMAVREQNRLKARADKYWEILQDVIGVIPDMVAIDDGTGRTVACNDKFAEILGAKKEDLMGKSILSTISRYGSLFHSVDGKEADAEGNVVAAGLYRALKEGHQLTVRLKDDRTFMVDCASVEAGGNILLARDVTDILAAKTQLDDAITSMPMAFSFFDADGKMIACNRDMERLHEQDRSWIASQSMESLLYDLLSRLKSVNGVPTDMQDGWHEAGVIEALTTGYTSFLGELKDGSWYQISSRKVDGGGFVVIAHDVTQRRQLEMNLERNEAQLRDVLKGQPFPVLILRNSDGCILFASNAAESVLGAGRNELIGSMIGRFMEKGDAAALPLLGSVSGRQGTLREATFQRMNGDSFPALYSGLKMVFQGNDATVMSFIDVEDKAQLEAELKAQREALFQSEKLNALGTLLAGVAHELNNPLTVVVANAHVLSMSSDDPALAERVQKITDAADRCSRIVRTFLSMARKGQGEKRPFKIDDCIRSARDICSFGYKTDKVDMDISIAPDVPEMIGDADQFSQVFINLFLNAQHALASQDGAKKVRLECIFDAATKEIQVDVLDNGPGIPENTQGRIFDPFFTTKDVGSGTGLGLFLVRGSVRSHGGTIDLMPPTPENALYRGAHFRLRLPLGTDVGEVQKVKATGKPKGVSSVLIVDDEPEILTSLSDILELDGHKVRAVSSGGKALEILKSQTFDVIISDLRMPGLSGQELFEALSQEHPELVRSIAFMTGDSLSAEAQQFLESCARPVVNKPFSPADIRALIYGIEKEQADT
ncbi:MAG: response regulator [Alphaproteobacteria bacterium]|nr:response regulator [Alphaproteobacteria bacterium]